MRFGSSIICIAALCQGCTLQQYTFFNEVSGTALVKHVTGTSETETPIDLSGQAPAALILDGGSFRQLLGTGNVDGTFTIRDVPPDTEYYLSGGSVYVVTSARNLDLGRVELGREGRARAGSSTRLELVVQGMNPWQATDHFDLYAPNVGAVGFFVDRGATTPPSIGSTTADFTFNYATIASPFLIDGRRGDILYVMQLVTRIIGSRSYQTIGRFAFTGSNYVQTNDGTDRLTVTFLQDVRQDQQVTVNQWQRSAFAVLGPSVNPGAQPLGYRLSLFTIPAGRNYGDYDLGSYLLDLFTTDSTDLNVGTMNYGNPFPSAWTTLSAAFAIFQVTYGTASINAAIGTVDQVTGTILPTIGPILGPVRSPKVDGANAFGGDATGTIRARASLVLTWTAPAQGTPSGYVVHVFLLGSEVRDVGQIVTTKLTVTMPPDLLRVGNTYVFKISAIAEQGVDLSQHPFRSGLPEHVAECLTSKVLIN